MEVQQLKMVCLKNSERLNMQEALIDGQNQLLIKNNVVISGLPSNESPTTTIVNNLLKTIGCEDLIQEISSMKYVDPKKTTSNHVKLKTSS